ncbi:MAG TPA: hypothetical protein VHO68_07900, partial [Bacteroidales bacterium]|nr:hypothetical protein [Bacteroidales bacterium]
MKKISGNIYIVLAYRILLIMFLFTLCRIGFYVFNIMMFPEIKAGQFLHLLSGGLVFDISAIVYINILFILSQIVPFDFRYSERYQRVTAWIYYITNATAIALNGMDFVYYRFIGKRATADVFGTFSNEDNLIKLFFRFLADYWMATLFTISLWFIMVWLYRKVRPVRPEVKRRIPYFAFNVIMIPVAIALVIGAARGGYRHSTRPITISNAARYVDNPRDVAIVLNTPFSLFRTYGKVSLVRHNFFSEEDLVKEYDPHHVALHQKPFSNENVVIIILESF